MSTNSPANRILFFDHIRYLMVLLVVVLHSAASYSNFVPWWSVKEPHEDAVFFDIVLLLLDVFLMPILYFIAGYFAISSFQKRGGRRFLLRKLKRLGLPLLIGIPIIGPSFAYMYQYTRNGFSNDMAFGRFWLDYMKGAGDFRIGMIPSVDHFSHGHLWFISLLLFFFIIFTLYASTHKSLGIDFTPHPSGHGSGTSVIVVLAVVGLISSMTTFVGNLCFASPENPDPWITIGNILQFQPAKVVSYILYFMMGIYAFYHHWFLKTTIPGHLAIWVLFCVLLIFCLLMAFQQLVLHFSLTMLLLYLSIRSFLCIAVLVAVTLWSYRYWNQPSRVHARLAINSYHIYIVHFVIVIMMQLIMARWPEGSVFVKFAIVSSVSIVFSYLFSQYALRPFPRLSVMGLYTIFFIMILQIHPTAS